MFAHVVNEDCMATMGRLPDDSVDLVITSPPYNMNLRIRNGAYCSRQITKEFSTKYEGFDDNLPIDEFYQFHLAALREMLRIAPLVFYNIQVVTGSKRAFFKIIGEMSDHLKEIIVWDKGNAQPAMGVGVLNRQSELLLVFDKHDAISRKFHSAQFDRGTLNDVWQIRSGKKPAAAKTHGAVFPQELVERILLNFSAEGARVYDPFAGTGTTGVVCKRLNRTFLGSEIVAEYAELANRLIGDQDAI